MAVDGFIPKRTLRLRSFRVLAFFAIVFGRVLFWDVLLRRIGFRRISIRTASDRHQRIARDFRHLAVELGGIWIKIGQFLSARVDMLPESVTSELVGLQDEVPAEPFVDMEAVVRGEFGDDWALTFPWIQQAPLASASLGQVHRARLPEDQPVVVKIQRPGIRRLVEVDLGSLSRVIGWLKRYRPIARRADLAALKDEFARTIWEELDYLAEAENARTFAEMFAENPEVRIPQVYTEQTTHCVLTLEDVYFTKITHYEEIEAAGIDQSEVADRLFRVYLHQIFEQGFFHADPHPGNLFVEPGAEGNWRLVFVDFGMVGRVSDQTRQGLRDLVIAVGTRDVDRLIQAYQELGVLLPGADLERIKQAERMVFDRFWGMSMDELREIHPEVMRKFAREYRDLLYDLPFQVPKDMIYLGRCVAILSGMCSGLNPEFNLFEGLRPFAEKLLEEEGGGWVSIVLDQLVEQGAALARLPKRLDQTMALIERGELKVEARLTTDTERDVRRLARSLDRLVWATLFGVLFLTGAFLLTREIEGIAYLSLGLSVLFLLKLLIS